MNAPLRDDGTLPPAAFPSVLVTLDPKAIPAEDETMAPTGSGAGGSPVGAAMMAGYEVLGELGRGGMGVVYRARHLALGRVVALKMILAGGYAGEDELARFRVEGEAIARLQHANIVQIYEVGEHDGLPFFSLEWRPGHALQSRVAWNRTRGKRRSHRFSQVQGRIDYVAAHRLG